MARQDNLRLQFDNSGKGGVEISDFKPQKHTVPMRQVGVANRPVMILQIPSVQLKDQLSVRDQAPILGAAVIVLAAKQTLIPAAARLHVTHANEWLRTRMDSERFRRSDDLTAILKRQGPSSTTLDHRP